MVNYKIPLIVLLCLPLKSLIGQNLSANAVDFAVSTLNKASFSGFKDKNAPLNVPTDDTTRQSTLFSTSSESNAPEICNNNVDDDGDGLIDCADPKCNCTGTIFPCDDNMYMLRVNPADGNQTLIERLTIIAGVPTHTTLFTFNLRLNGMAYYKGFLYVMDNGGTTLYRIDATGALVTLGTVANLPTPNVQWSGATIDPNGNYYVIEGTQFQNYRLYRIPLYPGGTYTATQVIGSGANNAIPFANNSGDIVMDEVGTLYAFIQANGTLANTSGLHTVDIATGAITKVGSESFIRTSLGSLFASADGKLYGYGVIDEPGLDQKYFYEVNKTTGVLTQIGGTGTSVGRSDGCSCPLRVTVSRTTTASCIKAGGTFCWDFSIKNTSGNIVPNAEFRDTLDSRFSYTFNVSTVQSTLRGIYGNSLQVTLSSFGGGTNNVVQVTNMNLPLSVSNFSLCGAALGNATFATNEIIYEQAFLKNLPALIGGLEGSDNPNTLGTDNDATPLTTAPVVRATNTSPYCVGQTIQLNATATVTTFAWTGPSAFTSGTQNPTRASATLAMAGKYYVTATNTSNCTNIDSTVVVVSSPPTVNVTGATTVCTGGTAILNATVSGISGTLQWQLSTDGGTNWSNITNATTNTLTTNVLTTNTTYRVLLTSYCGVSTSNTQLITVVGDPSVNITANTSAVCTGGGVTFNATSSNGTGSCTIQWQSSPDGTTWTGISGATGTTFTTASLNSAIRYRAQITCTGSGCCN